MLTEYLMKQCTMAVRLVTDLLLTLVTREKCVFLDWLASGYWSC